MERWHRGEHDDDRQDARPIVRGAGEDLLWCRYQPGGPETRDAYTYEGTAKRYLTTPYLAVFLANHGAYRGNQPDKEATDDQPDQQAKGNAGDHADVDVIVISDGTRKPFLA